MDTIFLNIENVNLQTDWNKYNKAIRLNRYWAKKLYWKKEDIASIIFGSKITPSDFEFVDLVANWQFKNGFPNKQITGVIDPYTFCKMLNINEVFVVSQKNFSDQINKKNKGLIPFSKTMGSDGYMLSETKDLYGKSFGVISLVADSFSTFDLLDPKIQYTILSKIGRYYRQITGDFNNIPMFRGISNISRGINKVAKPIALVSTAISIVCIVDDFTNDEKQWNASTILDIVETAAGILILIAALPMASVSPLILGGATLFLLLYGVGNLILDLSGNKNFGVRLNEELGRESGLWKKQIK